MIRLYHSPMACSLASRLALAESGLAHEISLVRTYKNEQRAPEYLAVNPAGRVPALSVDGAIVTESTAILPLVAALAPEANLLPTEPIPRAQAQALLSYISSSLHAAFTPAMFPERFTVGGDPEPLRAAAIERVGGALRLLETRLGVGDFLLGRFSVCDLYLLVFLFWRGNPAAQGKLPATPGLDALQQRLLARPAVGAVVSEDMAERQRV